MWATGNKRANPEVKSTEGFGDILQWWKTTIQNNPALKIRMSKEGQAFVWIPEYLKERPQLIKELASNIIVIESDASGKGWGTVSNTQLLQHRWGEDDSKKHSNHKEFNTVLQWVTHPDVTDTNALILWKTDNKCTEHYLNNRVGKIPEFNILADEIFRHADSKHLMLIGKHIKGKFNLTADALSR